MSLLGRLLAGGTLTFLGAVAIANAFHWAWPPGLMAAIGLFLVLATCATAFYDNKGSRN
jgi:hypothetical protein